MAGESAREVARRAREKAERLNKRAELFEQGADGEVATAAILATLPPGWISLHDVRWPGRRLANVDHVLIGPGGVFVIDSKNWTGRISLDGGHLRQNGYSREKAVAGAADAALAVSELISPYAAWVHPVLCFVGQDHLSGWCREVMVCSTANLVGMLTSRPVVFTPEHVSYLHGQLDIGLRRTAARPAGPSKGFTFQDRVTMSRQSARPRSRRSGGPSLSRFLVGVAMLIAFVGVGPQVATGIGGALAEQLTKNVGTPSCSESLDPRARSGEASAQPRKVKERAKSRAQERRQARESTTAPPAVNECATP
ncbi:nuclease-related domain-containing protein [Nocardioides mesophilus]|uniref:NERD domain-containing protein n=1 Tax=Nocardioides mesophilus TaxID=433659 RepID=A0A7G9R9P3_9ACTN|nr:nuclease-related domain-containing protein [Nocardioides mesophilus]QNN52318.1 NERD domain-containing protein [Nocardioides mesophilus]